MSDRSSAVLSYLETLSHDELIELLHSFATTHEDIRLVLEEKVAEESTKNNKLMVFTVGNEEIKLSPAIVKNYLVNGQSDKLTEQEIVYFMHLCKARKLNPFTKEVYLIKYGNQPATMVVSRDALEKRAIKHKEYNGKKVGIYVLRKSDGELIKRDSTIYLKDKEELIGAWCTVYRKDWENPVTVEVNLDEYIQTKSDGTPNTNWSNRPITMITKVAKAQALREAFIEELEGMYEAEESGIDLANISDVPQEQPKNVEVEDAEVVEEEEDLEKSLFGKNNEGNPFEKVEE